MALTKEYRVAKPFWFGGLLRQVGETIRLSAPEAKYRGDEIALVEQNSDQPALASKRRRAAGDQPE